MYGREAPLLVDQLLNKAPQERTPSGYASRLASTLQRAYRDVVRQHIRVREQNRIYRDLKQGRSEVIYEKGDAALLWGPISAGAPSAKTKLQYQWSAPCVVKERISALHYTMLKEKKLKDSTSYEVTPPIHVYRLRPFWPLDDGTPSVSNKPPKATMLWSPPKTHPVVGEWVVAVCPADDWQGKPFLLAKVVAIQGFGAATSFVLHFHGNFSGTVRGPHRPGFVDSKDGKLIFCAQTNTHRFRAWTSAMTKQDVRMSDILVVRPELTKTSMLSSELMSLLEDCDRIDWSRLSEEERQRDMFASA